MKEGKKKNITNLDKLKQIFAKQSNAIKNGERAVKYAMIVHSIQPSVTF